MNQMRRENISSANPWEAKVGYSRGVRVGPFINIAGTTAVDDDGNVVGAGDPYQQTCFILQKIQNTLKQFNASLQDVTRTRMYVTNISDWEKIGKAHGEFFTDIRPASTMVEVSRLISPELLVEIEADAILQSFF
jgi:enamine deaminase RidA (YjgF/YER057c/UK114 family)